MSFLVGSRKSCLQFYYKTLFNPKTAIVLTRSRKANTLKLRHSSRQGASFLIWSGQISATISDLLSLAYTVQWTLCRLRLISRNLFKPLMSTSQQSPWVSSLSSKAKAIVPPSLRWSPKWTQRRSQTSAISSNSLLRKSSWALNSTTIRCAILSVATGRPSSICGYTVAESQMQLP